MQCCALAVAVAGAHAQCNCSCTEAQPESKLAFSSSDAQLVRAFDWARKQAMAYVQGDRDPVGLWYETGLPGRTRFSMRDTSHQLVPVLNRYTIWQLSFDCRRFQ